MCVEGEEGSMKAADWSSLGFTAFQWTVHYHHMQVDSLLSLLKTLERCHRSVSSCGAILRHSDAGANKGHPTGNPEVD